MAIVRSLKARLGIAGDEAFIIAQDHSSRHLRDDVIWHHGDLTAATGSVHHIGRDTKSAGVTTQGFDDLDTLCDGGAEMSYSLRKVALIDVIGTYSIAYQLVHQGFHHVHMIVYTLEQYRLIAHGQTGLCDGGKGLHGSFADLLGVVVMCIEPHEGIFLQHCHQGRSKAHRQYHRGAGAQTHNIQMIDLAQFAQNLVQTFITQSEGISAG
ncbi:hypothetical protein DSECCO2_546100 [anaerobic digester metagenome]